MALTTLASVKTQLGISGSREDAVLTQLIRQCDAAIKNQVNQFIGHVISAISIANPTVVTCLGHGFGTGDVISITNSDSTPSIDGLQTVTRIDDDTFSVDVNVTVAGTAGGIAQQFTEFYSGDGTQLFRLRQRPVQSITSLWLDNTGYYGTGANAFDATTLLTEGTDFVLIRDNNNAAEKSMRGQVARINGLWTRPTGRAQGMLSAVPGLALGNIKVIYIGGYATVPYDLQLAMNNAVAIVRRIRSGGQALLSETYDFYQYTALTPEEQADAFGSVQGLLQNYKSWDW